MVGPTLPSGNGPSPTSPSPPPGKVLAGGQAGQPVLTLQQLGQLQVVLSLCPGLPTATNSLRVQLPNASYLTPHPTTLLSQP